MNGITYIHHSSPLVQNLYDPMLIRNLFEVIIHTPVCRKDLKVNFKRHIC